MIKYFHILYNNVVIGIIAHRILLKNLSKMGRVICIYIYRYSIGIYTIQNVTVIGVYAAAQISIHYIMYTYIHHGASEKIV